MGSISEESFFDALIVGAGFSGLDCLLKFRKLGLSVRVFEAEKYLGGTWWINRYPGARVDSETPIYQLLDVEEGWKEFEWTQRFPGRDEIMQYFKHLDNKLNLSKDIQYTTWVSGAVFHEEKHLWEIKTSDGKSTWARHLVLCLGFSSKRYTPAFKGLEKFKGQYFHSAVWPEKGIELAGKRVAVIGTGATGVQIIQEIGPLVEQLTVYQRTPNYALPMRQKSIASDKSPESSWKFPEKSEYERIFSEVSGTFAGMPKDGQEFTKDAFSSVSPEKRRQLYEHLWAHGGFAFWLGTFIEIFFSQEANDEVYAFWAEKVRQRLNSPERKDLLAPLTAPHAWGTKRLCLESTYYEVFNQENVKLINVKESPILGIGENGVITQNEGEIPVDLIIFATGFDTQTGGLLDMDLRNGAGLTLKEKWDDGVKTQFGMTISDFPNLFLLYGPQAPTAFVNAPTFIKIQTNWLGALFKRMKSKNETRIEAQKETEQAWIKEVWDLWNMTLCPGTDSWYQGANIPGKRREPLNWFGGIPKYIQVLGDCAKEDYEGFNIA